MIDLDLQPILACPVCTYNRFFPTWIPFTAVRLLAVLTIGFRSFDLVRLLGLFVGFEVVYYYLWKLGNWYVHPAVSEGVVSHASGIGLLVLVAGVPAMLLMRFASTFRYFMKPAAPKFTWRRALALIPLMIGIAFIEATHAISQPT